MGFLNTIKKGLGVRVRSSRKSKVEKLKEEIELAELIAKKEAVSAKQAQNTSKKVESEWDGILEKVRGYQDLLDELGINKEDDIAKLGNFIATIKGATEATGSPSAPPSPPITPSKAQKAPQNGDLVIPKEKIPMLLAQAKAAPAGTVKSELIKMLGG